MVAPPHGRRGRAFVIGSCVGAVGTGKREGCADPCPTGLCFAAIQPSDERCLWLGVLQGGRRRAHEYRPAGKGSRHIAAAPAAEPASRSEEHTSELQSLMRISYAVFCLKKKKRTSN